MGPKKKPKKRRCSSCNRFGHYTEDCQEEADLDVATTSLTSQISESLTESSIEETEDSSSRVWNSAISCSRSGVRGVVWYSARGQKNTGSARLQLQSTRLARKDPKSATCRLFSVHLVWRPWLKLPCLPHNTYSRQL
ncbi:uncharacterized protein LOC108668484 isoform X2 [Hyalella azteca]|uniref:Uncharacterized protein LOC108668484 isoform X2 n=1 Tax=Hyalella azteca TaxID=294128 RepID=A0A8B7NC88_HYAAZ|nr:uncharacterized protein LOC108668484 isoform X2 [Hyalella azteca]